MKLTDSQMTNIISGFRSGSRQGARSVSLVARTLLLLCALISASPSAPAQNIQYSQGSVGSSLNNTLQIPLGAYKGRGGASLPITLYYSSDLWRIKYRGTIYNTELASLSEPMADAKYAEFSRAGWTSSLNVPVLEWPNGNEVYNYDGKSVCLDCADPARSPGNYYKVPRLTIHMPDGSAHELRRADQPYIGAVNNTGVYYAVDGSRLRYDTSTATLYMPDGSRYVLGSTAVQFFNRNGNRLDYNRSSKQWTDTLGRVISSPPLSTADYTLPGVNDTPVTYDFRWGYLQGALEPDPATGATPALQHAGGHYVSGPPSMDNKPHGVGGESLFNSKLNENNDTLEYVLGASTPFNPVVLKELILPNGLSYKFQYNVYGEITKITYPTGGVEWLKYDKIKTVGSLSEPYDQASRGVVRRCVSPTGDAADQSCWDYGVTYDANTHTYKRWTINPDGTYSESYLFKAIASAKFGFADPRNGMTYEDRFYQTHQMLGGTPQGVTLLRRSLTESTYSSQNVSVTFSTITTTAPAMRNPRPTKQVSIILDTGGNALAKTLTYSYGNTMSSGAVTNQHEFTTGLDMVSSTESHFAEVTSPEPAQSGNIDAVSPGAGSIASTAVTTYLDDENYRGRNILGLPTSVVLKDANGQPVSKTVTGYDEADLQTYPDLSADPQWADPQTTARGNPTTVRRYVNASAADVPLSEECPAGVCLDTHAYFDQAGNVWKTSDARGNESVVVYPSEYKHAYPTATTSADPDGSGTGATALTTTTTYDFGTGLVVSATDANGQITEFEYADDAGAVDPMNRLRKVIRPDGGWTSYDYGETPGQPLYVRTTTSLDATRTTESYQYVDGLGRPSRSFASEGGSPATYLTADTQYDSMGRAWKASNPYRTTALTDPIPLSVKWTTTAYDALGRVSTVTLPDDSQVKTTYEGVYTTVEDQANKKRRQKVDALGRVVRVDEPNASGDLGLKDAPAQATYYDYNALGNLVHVKQGAGQSVQHRYFKYDALSRLTHEKQVEQTPNTSFNVYDPVTGNSSWTRKLVYDGTAGTKGLLTNHTDARGVTSMYTYDNLNRVKQVTHTDGTPTVTNYYDQDDNVYFNKGRLTEVKTAAVAAAAPAAAIPATSQAYDYDLMGRVKVHKQTVGTNVYSTSYAYGLGGQLESETYPSGRVVRQTYDGAGRLAGVDNGASISYANTFVYGSKGALTSVTLGNGTMQAFDYNDRLQLTTTSLAKAGTILQQYDYKYGQINVSTGALVELKNNGQIARIEGFIGGQKQWQQRFGYDSLGRLSQAAEYQGTSTTTRSYLISYGYDSFGNRYQRASENPSSANPLDYVAVEDNQIDKLTNRFVEAAGVFEYDAAGNVELDKKFTQRHYTYDANNRQRTVSTDDTAANAYTSVYDGTGQRVATIFGGQTSVMVYDAFGKLVAEYGQPVTGSGIQYVFTDHQGSTRLVTNGSGTPVSRHDYQPFGGEIYAGVGLRTEAQLYGQSDLVRQKHAGMERDEGSNLSYTLWRKQDHLSGRWTSPDPYGGSMTVSDPQSFNRYTYVNNDPVNLVDPDGLRADASQGWSSVSAGFWGGGFDFSSRPISNHIAEAMARHDSIRETGYDPAFDIYHGEVGVSYTPADANYTVSTTLHNPTPDQLNEAMNSLADTSDLLASTQGQVGRGRRSTPGRNPNHWRWVPTGRARGRWIYTGPGSWTYGTGKSPAPNRYNTYIRTGPGRGYRTHVFNASVEQFGKVVYTGTIDLRPTIMRIATGGRYPHKNDGSIFSNREGRLPNRFNGWYTEYVIPTQGINGAGPQRLVVGRDGNAWYTPNHYRSFEHIGNISTAPPGQ